MLNSHWHKLSICSLLIVGSLAFLPLKAEVVPPPPARDPIAYHHGGNWNNHHGNHWRGDWGRGSYYHRPYNYYYNDPYYYYYDDGYYPYYYDSGINIRFR